MIRMVRSLLYWGFFAAVALVVHAYFLVPLKASPETRKTIPEMVGDLARDVGQQYSAIKKMLPKEEAPAEAPVDDPEPQPMPEAKPRPPAPAPDPTLTGTGATPDPAQPATKEPPVPDWTPEPKQVPEPMPEPAPDPAKIEPKPAAEPEKPAPEAPKREPVSQPTGAVIAALADYRLFLAREMKGAREYEEGSHVPKLRFGDNTPEENRSINRYFGMEIIAYAKSMTFYVYIDADQDLYRKSSDFAYVRKFSNRVIYRSSPYFENLRVEASRRAGAEPDELVLAQLLKPSSAAYVAWKEREAAKRAGVKLDDVDACEASFARTGFGAWIVRIDALAMRNGRTIPVQDFEWSRVNNGEVR